MPLRPRAALLAATPVLVAAACTSQGAVNREPHTGATTASAVDGVQTVTVKATDAYRFDPSTITVHPGKVRIVLQNVGKGAPHNWSLQGFAAAFVPLAQAGATREATFTAPAPGRYTYVCTIHVKQGQTGTLVVVPH